MCNFWLFFFFKSFWKNYTINRYLLELLHSKFKQLYRILLLESQMKKKIFVSTQGLNSWNYFFFSTYLPISIIHRATTRSQSAQFNFPRCLFPVIKTSSGEKCYFHEWRRVIMGTVPTSAIKGTEFHRAREHCAYIKSLGVRLTCLSLCFHGGSHARFSFIEPFSILSPISFPFFFTIHASLWLFLRIICLYIVYDSLLFRFVFPSNLGLRSKFTVKEIIILPLIRTIDSGWRSRDCSRAMEVEIISRS